MEMTTVNYRPFLFIFIITVSVSSIVFIEPAPHDLLMVVLLFTAFLSGYTVYTDFHFWPLLGLLIFLASNVVSLYFIQEVSPAMHYFIITLYCMMMWGGLTGISFYFGKGLLPVLFKSYTAAALLVAVPGITAYLLQGSILDMFLWGGGRVQGLFKDPNVFGPFLIPPALYALWKLGRSKQTKKALFSWTGIFLILSLGILLSFSRAAWGQFILVIGVFFLMINDRSTRRTKVLFIITAVIMPVLVFTVMKTNAGELFFNRTGLQAYDTVRFQEQGKSIDYVLSYPFGFGPGQSELFLNQSTHNLFIRVLSENGIIGLSSVIFFWSITLFRSFQVNKQIDVKYKGYFVIITASLIGILFNSMFIDSMHWRHFWLLLALPWMNLNGENK